MSARAPGDPRCKDCPKPREPGRSRCEACAELHRNAARATAAKRRKCKHCVTCGRPVAKRQDGKPATLCATHLRYYTEHRKLMNDYAGQFDELAKLRGGPRIVEGIAAEKLGRE